ncbi:MAG: peptidoglycan-binding protein, partial [Pseudomonadota bacterium]
RRGPAPAPTEALALGPNGIYAPALAAAAAQSGLSAGAIAALIDAEAAKTSDGRWDPKSDNPASTARGLAQFLEGTWLDQAAHPARSLHRRAREAGLIAEDGSVLDRAALLALRDTPDLAILAAAEMAADNLLALARLGYAPVDDQAAARLAYLAHHEGLAGAHAHLTGATTAARAARRLTANLADEGRVAQLVAAHGGAHHEAYAAWLEGYIEARIEPDRFRSVVN